MGGDENDLFFFGQEFDGLPPVDSRVLDLIDQDDRGIAHIGGIAIMSALDCPPLSWVTLVSLENFSPPVRWRRKTLFHDFPDIFGKPAPGMHFQELLDRQIHHEIHILGELGDNFTAISKR